MSNTRVFFAMPDRWMDNVQLTGEHDRPPDPYDTYRNQKQKKSFETFPYYMYRYNHHRCASKTEAQARSNHICNNKYINLPTCTNITIIIIIIKYPQQLETDAMKYNYYLAQT